MLDDKLQSVMSRNQEMLQWCFIVVRMKNQTYLYGIHMLSSIEGLRE